MTQNKIKNKINEINEHIRVINCLRFYLKVLDLTGNKRFGPIDENYPLHALSSLVKLRLWGCLLQSVAHSSEEGSLLARRLTPSDTEIPYSIEGGNTPLG